MVGTLDMTGMIVVAFLVIVAVYILMRFMGGQPDGEEAEEGTIAPRVERPAEMSDEEFVASYTGPMLEDAMEKLGMAIESIGSGLGYYGRSAWEDAGGELHLAVNNIDDAAGRLREVVGMVEDPGSEPARQAKARLEECRRMRALAIRMEEACDAMVAGKTEEARQLEASLPELKKLADEWHPDASL